MAKLWPLLLLWTTTLTGILCRDRPRITPDKEELEINTGEDIELTCEGNSPLKWVYPGIENKKTDTYSSSPVSLDPSTYKRPGYESRLYRKKARYMDTGYYYCLNEALKPGDLDAEDKVYVYVKDTKHPFVADDYFFSEDTTEDGPFILKCLPSSPSFNIQLFKESVEQNVTRDGNGGTWRFDPKQGFLLNRIYKKDSGNYECLFGDENVMINVNVLKKSKTMAKPLIESYAGADLVAGKNLTLTCRVTVEQDVKANLSWKCPNKTGHKVEGTQVYNKTRRNTGQITRNLTIYNMRQEDSGTYTCLATDHDNNTNQDSTTITVIAGNTTFIDFNLQAGASNHTEVKRGQKVTWIVGIEAYPRPEVSWFAPTGARLSDSKKYTIHTDLSSKSNTKLEIRDVRVGDSGCYKLRAVSKDLNKSLLLCLLVRSKPIAEIKSLLKYEVGKQYIISCTAEGYPLPVITWFFKPCTDKAGHKCRESPLKPTDYSQKNVNETAVRSMLNITAKETGFVVCIAKNNEGNSTREHVFTVSVITNSGPNVGLIVGVIIVTLILLALIGILSYRIYKEKTLRKQLQKGGILHFENGDLDCLNPDLPIDDQAELLPYNKQWEFPREGLKLGRQLGAGAFGIVVKAQAQGILEGEAVTTVAVKMVKRNADFVFMKALASELKIMVHLGKHLNVVNLLGACTNNITKRELLVIVEYCPYGNLHNYLLRHRESFINQVDPKTGELDATIGQEILAVAEYTNRKLRSKVSQVSFSNSGDDNSSVTYRSMGENSGSICMQPTGETSSGSGGSGSTVQPEWRSNYRSDYKGQVRPICTQDLVCWSFQVARGMEYLVSRKVMHGDLAARNILLAEDNIVKICDFGLAKSMYKSENYKKKGDGPLPIKWMALESIKDRLFSTQSDVWSYGIVLWELFSLATTPYPGMQPNEDFYNKLVSGYRMERPQYATEKMYRLMTQCWLTNPEHRPNFTELAEETGLFLDSILRNHYLELNDPYMQMNLQWKKENSKDYLSMMSAPTYNNLVSPMKEEPANIYINSPVFAESNNPVSEVDSGYLNMSRPTSPFATTPVSAVPSPKWPLSTGNNPFATTPVSAMPSPRWPLSTGNGASATNRGSENFNLMGDF